MEAPQPIHDELHRIVTTVAIWKRDADGTLRYLMTKRSPHKKVWPNKWTIPGGGLTVEDYVSTPPDPNSPDSPRWVGVLERTLQREVQEEVGVETETPRLFNDMPANITFIRPDGIPVIIFRFHANYKGGEVVLDEDATEYAWVSAADVGSYDCIQGIAEDILAIEHELST